MACLASRIPYGTAVTRERLLQIGGAESDAARAGLAQLPRALPRGHRPLEVAARRARPASPSPPSASAGQRRAARLCGFKFVALDLEPFRSGRMNEAVGLPSAGAHA